MERQPRSKFHAEFRSRRRNAASAGIRVFCARPASQRGQALTEYVLLIAVVTAFSFGLMVTFGRVMREGVQTFNVVLEQELESGNYQGRENVWNE